MLRDSIDPLMLCVVYLKNIVQFLQKITAKPNMWPYLAIVGYQSLYREKNIFELKQVGSDKFEKPIVIPDQEELKEQLKGKADYNLFGILQLCFLHISQQQQK